MTEEFLEHYGVKAAKTSYSAAKTSLRAQQIKRQFAKGGWKL